MLKVLLAALLLSAPTLHAVEPSGEIDLEHARALIDQGEALREKADYEYRLAAPGCYERFLVNRCLGRLHRERLEKIRQARELEMAGREMQLAHRRYEVSERGLPDHFVEPAPTIAIPAAIAPAEPEKDAAEAEALRRQRAAEAERLEAAARAERRRRDAERTEERARAEEAAAERARQAERDRERYEERLRRHDIRD